MSFVTFIIGVAILVVVLKILTFPLKLIFKFVINSIIGGVVLFLLAKIGIFVIVAWWSILLVGVLGVPGVIIAVILSLIL